MKKILLIHWLVMFMSIGSMVAAPALPVRHRLVQPDGTTITVYLRGDEHLHFYETTDGLMLQKSSNGFYHYAELSAAGSVIAGSYVGHETGYRSEAEKLYIKGIKQAALRDAMIRESDDEAVGVKQRVAPGTIRTEFPTSGEVKGLVVLAQYADIKFTSGATQEAYDRVMNEENYTGDIASGSVRDYFLNQSGGKLKLAFDVVGPVTLSKKREYYGSSEDLGRERVPEMIEEAVILAREAAPDLDFSGYDKNGDGEIDFVYVIYAGYGEAQGGPEESVWPQSSSLSYVSWEKYDGLFLGRYSCSCELKGKVGENLDGIGTFCHEFGHILGLPDIYDPKYSGCYGMGYWDVMDVGSYNNDSKTPAGYTAMDKYTLGWITPDILDSPQHVELEALSVSNKAYFLVSESNPNEYFTFENRQNVGWDAALPGHGLLISHVEYSRPIWKGNMVNTAGYEHVSLVAADDNRMENSQGNVFPGTTGSTLFSDTTTPAMKWNSGESTGKSVSGIQEIDGVISFDFTSNESGIISRPTEESFVYGMDKAVRVVNGSGSEVTIYSTDGCLVYKGMETDGSIAVSRGLYIVRLGDETFKVAVR